MGGWFMSCWMNCCERCGPPFTPFPLTGMLSVRRRFWGFWPMFVGCMNVGVGYDQSRQVASRHSASSRAGEPGVASRSARFSSKYESLLYSLFALLSSFITHLSQSAWPLDQRGSVWGYLGSGAPGTLTTCVGRPKIRCISCAALF